jgi:hypothetical protein
MEEEFYECQLSAVCHCGSPKVIGAYVCAGCWQSLPEAVKARVTWLEALRAEMRALVYQIEQTARLRNPDRLRIFAANEGGSKTAEANDIAPNRQRCARDGRQLLREHFRRLRFQMSLVEEQESAERKPDRRGG